MYSYHESCPLTCIWHERIPGVLFFIMSTKGIVIGVVAIVLIAIIGYFIYSNVKKTEETSTQNPEQQTAATSTPPVQGQEVKVGTGKEAILGTEVTVEYVGKLPDGTIFDSSQVQGKPLTFVLGSPGIIPGFQIGVRGMKEGGERIIAIPPELGYGAQQNGPIPPNSTLIFELKLLTVEESSSTPVTP